MLFGLPLIVSPLSYSLASLFALSLSLSRSQVHSRSISISVSLSLSLSIPLDPSVKLLSHLSLIYPLTHTRTRADPPGPGGEAVAAVGAGPDGNKALVRWGPSKTASSRSMPPVHSLAHATSIRGPSETSQRVCDDDGLSSCPAPRREHPLCPLALMPTAYFPLCTLSPTRMQRGRSTASFLPLSTSWPPETSSRGAGPCGGFGQRA